QLDQAKVKESDTGPGIAPEHLAKVFDRFWQVQRPRSKGSGLGLSIAKGIVEAHGGVIWAESQVGLGSQFYFTAPIVDEATMSAETAASSVIS
ncbi:MAG TPA: ATP-binding protein, partial [Terriglobia bacterium]|nr:ATP-binding protein [Terriglobia bacterium]